jgi:hypothetical protein
MMANAVHSSMLSTVQQNLGMVGYISTSEPVSEPLTSSQQQGEIGHILLPIARIATDLTHTRAEIAMKTRGLT